MTRQALAGFIVINIVVSLVVVIGIILIWDYTQEDETPSRQPSSGITSNPPLTRDVAAVPDAGLSGTIGVMEITMEAQQRRVMTLEAIAATAGQQLPTDTPFVNSGVDDEVPPIEPSILTQIILPPGINSGGGSNDGAATTPEPDDGCERYTVQDGDVCSTIAQRFEVDTIELIQLNNIDPDCITLIPGQVLRIPGPNCQIPPTIPPPTPTPTITRTPFTIGTFVSTNTPEPTAAPSDADVRITSVSNAGRVIDEQVRIQNFGDQAVNLRNWRLSDSQGNSFVFPEALIQPNQPIIIYTRVGQNAPAALYWNQTTAMWDSGETVTLENAEGTVQSEFVIEGE